MDTEVIVPIVIAILGGGTIGVVFTTVFNRICQKRDKKDEILKEIKWLKEQSLRRDIEISKLQLTQLIQHSPQDHRAIIEEAERYFYTLHGNSWMIGILDEWGEKEGVDTSRFRTAHEINQKLEGGHV